MSEPDWINSDSWDEFEWEKAFKHSEHKSSKYFRLLSRFGDMPNAEEMISNQIGDLMPLYEDFASDLMLEDDWRTDFDPELGMGNDDEVRQDEGLYYESYPVFQRARQIAMGWSNILSSVLLEEDRFWGLKVLFHMGRVLSYVSMAINDGGFDNPDRSIAFCKRSLHEVNFILGELNNMQSKSPQYKNMFESISNYLLEEHDQLIELLTSCRKRKSDDESTDDDDSSE